MAPPFGFTCSASSGRARATISADEGPRDDTSLDALAKLAPVFRKGGTVTAGNASGVNDGSCALLIASESAVKANGLTPRARILGMASAGVAPRVMGMGPAPASKKLSARLGIPVGKFDVIELNEAFAAQALAVLRDLGVPDDAAHVDLLRIGLEQLDDREGLGRERLVELDEIDVAESQARSGK